MCDNVNNKVLSLPLSLFLSLHYDDIMVISEQIRVITYACFAYEQERKQLYIDIDHDDDEDKNRERDERERDEIYKTSFFFSRACKNQTRMIMWSSTIAEIN